MKFKKITHMIIVIEYHENQKIMFKKGSNNVGASKSKSPNEILVTVRILETK